MRDNKHIFSYLILHTEIIIYVHIYHITMYIKEYRHKGHHIALVVFDYTCSTRNIMFNIYNFHFVHLNACIFKSIAQKHNPHFSQSPCHGSRQGSSWQMHLLSAFLIPSHISPFRIWRNLSSLLVFTGLCSIFAVVAPCGFLGRTDATGGGDRPSADPEWHHPNVRHGCKPVVVFFLCIPYL